MAMRIFGWLPLAAALAVPAPLLAQDWTPTGDRILSDPTYLPMQGQLLGESSYQYDSLNSSQFNAAGGQTSASHSATNGLTQYFAYGITNALSVNVGDTYDWTHTFTAPSGAADFDRNANGFTDPTFGATYRLLDQPRAPLSLDLSADYAPDAIGAKSPSGLGDGGEARGGDQFDLRLAVGREMRFMTVQGYFEETHDGRATSYDAAGDGQTTSAFWQPRLGLATQTRLSDRISVNVGGEYNFRTNHDVFDAANASAFDRGDFGDVSAALNYHFIPNRLVGSLVYSHTFYSPTDVAYFGGPGDDYSVQHSGDSVGAQLRYVFR